MGFLKFTLFIAAFTSAFLTIAQKNQNEQISGMENGSYSVYKPIEKSYKKYSLEKAKKPWPVEFTKEGGLCSKVFIKRVGIIDEFYDADLPAEPAYYLNTTSNTVVTVIDKKIYYYSYSAKTGAKIDYILVLNGGVGRFEDETAALEAYRKSMKSKQSGARDERKTENAEIAKKEAAENSLEGKDIKSLNIKLIDAPAEIGMLSVVSIGVEAVLTNGKILKTKNLGGKTPYSDFETKVTGGDYSGGDFKVASDSRKIPNDEINIEVWSKYNKQVKGSFTHPINYKSDIFYQYQGNGGSYGRGGVSGKSVNGGHGKDGRTVYVKATKQLVNGENITHVVITDISGSVLAEAKMNVSNKITINVSGGNGGNGAKGHFSGDNGGNGGDGGNAGDIYLSGTGVSQLELVVINNAGNAGRGGAGNESYNASGRSGRKGLKGNIIK